MTEKTEDYQEEPRASLGDRVELAQAMSRVAELFASKDDQTTVHIVNLQISKILAGISNEQQLIRIDDCIYRY